MSTEKNEKADMTDFMSDKNASAIRVPDLDWLSLTADDVKNIPVPMNIEVIPQLQENWKRTGEASANLLPYQTKSESVGPSDKITEENIRDVVYAAKKDMMKGITGKALAQKLASTYPKNLITAASDELKKLSAEQGLLGNVYVDVSPYDSCADAARLLGANKIRLAKYVVGTPRRHVCSSHAAGYCKELRKNVVASMEYTEDVLKGYTTHCRMAGLIGPEDVIDSKDVLRAAFLRSAEDKAPEPIKTEKQASEPRVSEKDLSEMLLKAAAATEKDQALSRFLDVRPILAFIQDEMLKGKIGKNLKEAMRKKYLDSDLEKYATEIRKVASLQGLLGNVYVDVSFYRDAEEAIKSIKNASVNPSYLIQSYKKDTFDDTLRVVSANTGCEILPRDGKIDKKVACSYLDDLQFSQRISSDRANEARKMLQAGENILGILREAFLSTISYKPPVREGGVQASFYQEPVRKYANRDKLKEATYRAVEAGFPIEKIESKLIQQIPTAEAVGMVRTVLAAVREIDANVLTKCSKEKYQFSLDVRLKKASKCDGCIMSSIGGCTKLGLKFAETAKKDEKKKDAPKTNVDPKTEKVLLKDNPDETQKNIRKEFDMDDYAGSNVNIALDKMRGQDKLGMDVSFNSIGLDDVLSSDSI